MEVGAVLAMPVLCRGGEERATALEGLLSLAFLLPLTPPGFSGSTALSGVLQGKLAVTRKARKSFGVQCISLGVGQLPYPHPGKMKDHWICHPVPIQLGCLFSGPCSLDFAQKEWPRALAVPCASGTVGDKPHISPQGTHVLTHSFLM